MKLMTQGTRNRVYPILVVIAIVFCLLVGVYSQAHGQDLIGTVSTQQATLLPEETGTNLVGAIPRWYALDIDNRHSLPGLYPYGSLEVKLNTNVRFGRYDFSTGVLGRQIGVWELQKSGVSRSAFAWRTTDISRTTHILGELTVNSKASYFNAWKFASRFMRAGSSIKFFGKEVAGFDYQVFEMTFEGEKADNANKVRFHHTWESGRGRTMAYLNWMDYSKGVMMNIRLLDNSAVSVENVNGISVYVLETPPIQGWTTEPTYTILGPTESAQGFSFVIPMITLEPVAYYLKNGCVTWRAQFDLTAGTDFGAAVVGVGDSAAGTRPDNYVGLDDIFGRTRGIPVPVDEGTCQPGIW